ncbi:MAG: hypothetical protein ACI9SP_004805 [Arenicella sp.]|jgi:hypothetical protein
MTNQNNIRSFIFSRYAIFIYGFAVLTWWWFSYQATLIHLKGFGIESPKDESQLFISLISANLFVWSALVQIIAGTIVFYLLKVVPRNQSKFLSHFLWSVFIVVLLYASKILSENT